jgi:large subunit ribosomal protein L20
MAKISFTPTRHRRRKKVLKMAKGYFGSKSTLYKTAHEQVMRSLQYAYRDRKQRKRYFRRLWISRINAGAMLFGMKYSRFMYGLSLAKVDVNRKILADLAYLKPETFAKYIQLSKEALEQFQQILKQQEAQKTPTIQEELKEDKIQNLETELSLQYKQLEYKKTVEFLQQETQTEQKIFLQTENAKVLSTEFLEDKTDDDVKIKSSLKQTKETKISFDLSKMLLPELKKLAKEHKVPNFSKLKKNEIVAILKKSLALK